MTSVRTGRPKRFLVIDDEQPIALLMKEGITSAGHRCDIASGENDAWKLLQHNTYDYVVADLRLSGKQDHGLGSRATGVLSTDDAEGAGVRLLREVRLGEFAPRNQGAKTILLTGNPYVSGKDYRCDLPSGVDLVVAKPLTPNQLLHQALQLATPGRSRG